MNICLLLLVLVVSPGLSFYFGDNVDLRIFFNLKQVLEYFRNETDPLAEKILYAFEHDCSALEERILPRLRKPFVVVEGNQVQSRNVVGMRLARMMKGRYLVHPAHCLQQFSSVLPRGTFFRRAFYVLSLYALSYDAKFHLSLNRAVVINGYWWDTLTFALVQAFSPEDTPEISSKVFQFPPDILQPDLVFFLNFPDSLYYRQVTTRSPQTWKPRILQMYRQLQQRGEPVVIQELTGVYRVTTDALYEKVIVNLSSTRDIWFENRRSVNFDYRNQ